MARKITLTGTSPPARDRPRRAPPRGAVGALQSSLTKLQENAVQEIEPDLIDEAGFEDRLGLDPDAQRRLQDSLREHGQQVPVLLRPHPEVEGRYEIVYGRRRLMALRALGMTVRAMVRHLDAADMAIAQGQENTAREDLSFIEKASFAAQLAQAGYGRQTIASALSMDLPMVSRMLKAGNAFDVAFLRRVGSAPGIGRDRWLALARLFESADARERAVIALERPGFAAMASDERFEAVFAAASDRPAPRTAGARVVADPTGAKLADVRTTARAVTLRLSGDFGTWLGDNAEDVLTELHARWQRERG